MDKVLNSDSGFVNAFVINPDTMLGLFNMWEGGPGQKFSNVKIKTVCTTPPPP